MRARKGIGTGILIFVLSCGLAAENAEKAQKKELEAQAKAIIVEAKSLEKSGELVEARTKYTESQAMIETNDAADAIKHLGTLRRAIDGKSVTARPTGKVINCPMVDERTYVPRGVTPIHAAPLVDEIDLMTVPL